LTLEIKKYCGSEQDTKTAQQQRRVEELLATNSSCFEYEGRTYEVHQDVFPPQSAYTTSMLLSQVAERAAHSKNALDMGCGTGIVAFVMKSHGAANVWAVDIHEAAIRNARVNALKYEEFKNIVFFRSDLFLSVPCDIKFDLIVFNHPYYAIKGARIMGMGCDGGRPIIARFLQNVREYCASPVTILMPFSSIAGSDNDPSTIAKDLGYAVETIDVQHNQGMEHFVYQITNE